MLMQDQLLASSMATAAAPNPAAPVDPSSTDAYAMSFPVPATTSSAPVLRPAMVGGRQSSGTRTPRLGLAIPPSPNVGPVNGATSSVSQFSGISQLSGHTQTSSRPLLPKLSLATPQVSARSSLPKLSLATPMGSTATPYENGLQNGRPHIQPFTGQSASGGSESSAAHSRSGSFGPMDGRNSGPTSAGSQFSALSFASQYAKGLGMPHGTPDPASAVGSVYSERSECGVGMERDGSMNGLPEIDRLSLERVRNLDVEDLDDDGWRIASSDKRITELSSLGEGAGGAVTRCILKGGKTVFAMKVITTNPDPDVKKQIVRELGFNKDCASEHICRYYGAFVDSQTATISIAMEFCEGGSLDSVYREVKKLGGRTGEKVLGKIAEGVLNGLTYLHSKKIIHRDIKPSNILLCRDGQVKLCDFGVSGEFGTKGDANTFIGTSYYMAPERITGQSYTITSDVWSTGVTLLEVAQHRFPFPADGTDAQPRAGLIDLLTFIVSQPIPKLKDEADKGIEWSENFKYFIECCLEKDPSRRASPWRMLEHPWMIEMRPKRVNMAHFLAKVWGWEETSTNIARKASQVSKRQSKLISPLAQ